MAKSILAVDNADVGPVADESVNISGLTTGATVEFRALGVNEDIAEVVMTDAAALANVSISFNCCFVRLSKPYFNIWCRQHAPKVSQAPVVSIVFFCKNAGTSTSISL